MMEMLCSETNRMDKNCPAALNPGAARTLRLPKLVLESIARRRARPEQANRQRSESGRAQLLERRIVRGKRMAVRLRKVWWESVEVKFEQYIARASGDCGSVIRNQLFVPSIGPKKAQRVPDGRTVRSDQVAQRRTRRPAVAHSIYSTAIFAPRWPGFDNRSIRLSITARMPFRNSMRDFVKCSRTSGDTPQHYRN